MESSRFIGNRTAAHTGKLYSERSSWRCMDDIKIQPTPSGRLCRSALKQSSLAHPGQHWELSRHRSRKYNGSRNKILDPRDKYRRPNTRYASSFLKYLCHPCFPSRTEINFHALLPGRPTIARYTAFIGSSGEFPARYRVRCFPKNLLAIHSRSIERGALVCRHSETISKGFR